MKCPRKTHFNTQCPPPVFGRSVNPISTRGHIIPTQYYVPSRIFRPCYGPVTSQTPNSFHSNTINITFLLRDRFENSFWGLAACTVIFIFQTIFHHASQLKMTRKFKTCLWYIFVSCNNNTNFFCNFHIPFALEYLLLKMHGYIIQENCSMQMHTYIWVGNLTYSPTYVGMQNIQVLSYSYCNKVQLTRDTFYAPETSQTTMSLHSIQTQCPRANMNSKMRGAILMPMQYHEIGKKSNR